MNILLIGSGGREHALAWKLKQSRHLTQLFCAPGNPGIAKLATCMPVKADDNKGLLELAQAVSAELTIVGPEAPLAAGIVDAFQQAGLLIFGPTRAAARIESSKSFAKDLMRRRGIATAVAKSYTDMGQALKGLDQFKSPYVIKVDGLAAGKGVTIAPDRASAERFIREALEANLFGASGRMILIEEHLEGQELSVFALSDGRRALPMRPAQDYKRALDGDQGPNTGGMGAYIPVPHIPAGIMQDALDKVLQPVVEGLAEEGSPYRGLLYAGLMLTADGLKVIEFNCRFGDPETQVILPALQDDLLELMMESVGAGFKRTHLNFSSDAAVCVVAASGGYPGMYRTGHPITGLEEAERDGALIFHAGTSTRDDTVLTAGGRVLNAVGTGTGLAEAARKAYGALDHIKFEGIYYRRDIAARALKNLDPVAGRSTQT